MLNNRRPMFYPFDAPIKVIQRRVVYDDINYDLNTNKFSAYPISYDPKTQWETIAITPSMDDCVVIPTGYGNIIIDIDRTFPNTLKTEAFSRLFGIKQLSTTSRVYLDGEMSRWDHSLLAAYSSHIASRFLGHDEYTQRLQAIHGLVHDVNHLPFGHSSDPLYEKYSGSSMNALTRKKLDKISQEIEKDGIKYGDLVNLLDGRDPKHQILTSPFGTDRGSYVPLDASRTDKSIYDRMTVDYLRLMENFVFRDGKLGVNQAALQDAENMLLTRQRLYMRVYYHAMKQVWERMLQQMFDQILSDGTFTIDEFAEKTDGIQYELELTNGNPLVKRILSYMKVQWPVRIVGMLKTDRYKESKFRLYGMQTMGTWFVPSLESFETQHTTVNEAENLSKRSTDMYYLKNVEERARKILGVDFAVCAISPSSDRFIENDALIYNPDGFQNLFALDPKFADEMKKEWKAAWHAVVAVDPADYLEASKRSKGKLEEIFFG